MTSANEYNDSPAPRARAKKGSGNIFPLIIFIVTAATVGFYFYLKKNPPNTYLDYGTAVEPPQMQSIHVEEEQLSTDTAAPPQHDFLRIKEETGKPKQASVPGSSESSENKTFALHSESGIAETDLLPTGGVPKETEGYDQYIRTLNNFYTHLDKQPYMKEFVLLGTSKEHFSRLIQKLLDNPPVVTRETDDLFTLLKNTAHFFRILGKENIMLLKGILDRERDSLEVMLKSFYSLTSRPQLLKEEFGLEIKPDSLYDYAGFLLHTMGGRLYLFRRDSTSRLAVTYYAVLVIDRANSQGNSKHGIDIRPALSSLVEEIEIGGKRLKFREEYLDRLYDLQEKYQ